MAFKDIKGQEQAVEFFRSSVNRDRLAHAYLFLGPEGVGKTLTAQNLAKFLNCEAPVREAEQLIDCCDKCSSCRKIDNFNHPDVHWLNREGGPKKISIDDIRTLQKEIALKAYESRLKIFTILEAHNMTREAASSLLKTLEEPPGLSLIILTSADIGGLIPTIVSRCQLVKFYLLNYNRLKEILSTDYRMSAEDTQFLSHQAEGRIGQALSLEAKALLSEKNRIIERVCQSSGRVSFDLFDIKDKRNLSYQIRYLLNWFRDLLILKAGLPKSSIINADRTAQIESQAGRYSFGHLEQIMDKIIEAHRLIEQNVNPKIALEVMLIGIRPCKR